MSTDKVSAGERRRGETVHTVEIYDPPMCCPTGVCGPSVDPALLAVQEMILALEQQGAAVKRYMLTTHPARFLQEPAVAALLRTPEGVKALPVTVVNGTVLKQGSYPSLAEVQAALASR